MASIVEQIDNPSFIRKGKYERYVKRQTHKYRRRKMKQWLNGHARTEPNDKQFFGWTS